MNKTIGIMGDSPDIKTGFSVITTQVKNAFNRAGWDVAILAQMDTTRPSPFEDWDYWKWPVTGNDILGIGLMYQFFRDVQPDLLYLIADPGSTYNRMTRMLNPPVFGRRDTAGGVAWKVPVMTNFPVEGLPLNPTYVQQAEWATHAMTWTAWGAEQYAREGTEVAVGSLAADHANFHPLTAETRAHVKRLFRMDDRFNIMTLSANRRKSRLPVLIETAVELKRRGITDFSIYMHTGPEPNVVDGGWPLGWMVEKYRAYVDDRTLVWFPPYTKIETAFSGAAYEDDDDRLSVDELMTIEKPFIGEKRTKMWARLSMNTIYNLFDLYIDVNANHGFNLPLVEGMRCGVATAFVDDGFARSHLFNGVSYPMLPDTNVHDWWHNGVILPLVSVDTVLRAIMHFKENETACMAWAAKGKQWADTLHWRDTTDKIVSIACDLTK